MTVVFPDVLGDLRAWLRSHADLTPLIAARVFFRAPVKPTYPFICLYRTGGAVQDGEVPLQDIRVAFDVWGRDTSQFAQTTAVQLALESACHTLPVPIKLGGTWVCNAQVTSVIFLPDPDTGDPRYVIDSTFTVKKA